MNGQARGMHPLELLTLIAAMVIALGLMVSLARYVRRESAVGLTGDALRRAELAIRQYVEAAGALPALAPLDIAAATEESLQRAARASNSAWVRQLLAVASPHGLDALPQSIFDGRVLRDAWGAPLLLAPGGHARLGRSAAPGAPLVVSGGPDRRLLSPEDNLFSDEPP